MNKIIFFDTETTGLDPKVNGIHQLAGEITIDDKVIERFDFRIKPFKGCEIDPKALEISNTNALDLKKYEQESQICFLLCEILERHLDYKDKKDKFFLAGWRMPEFDSKFLKALFERNNGADDFKSFFWSNPIDIKVLATQYLIDKRREMESFSLVSVAKYLGVEVDESKLHGAAYDAYLSRIIYEIVK
jgi:DNA polymerase-3 subunit epsilon